MKYEWINEMKEEGMSDCGDDTIKRGERYYRI